jgi:hypothetical protein
MRICRRCSVPMRRIYHTWYKCWAWRCPECNYTVTIAPKEEK